MNLQTPAPDPSLAGFVSQIVLMEVDKPHVDLVLPLIAKGYPSIVFQSVESGSILVEGSAADNLILYGQNLKPIELAFRGRFSILAFFLYPHVLKSVFGFNAWEVTDKYLDLSMMRPARDMNLKEQLLNTPDAAQRLRLLTSFLKALFNINRLSHPGACAVPSDAVSHSTRIIRARKGLVSLKTIQDELGMTERSLQRLFESNVGVSPRLFAKICRFDAVLRQLSGGHFSRLGDLAYDNGFADQSHLIRDFREFTKVTPKEYLKKSAEFLA
jgi:AraC-like DNA-binding protein